jgi:WD40 repeat protein
MANRLFSLIMTAALWTVLPPPAVVRAEPQMPRHKQEIDTVLVISASLSPDGRKLAVCGANPGEGCIQVLDTHDGSFTFSVTIPDTPYEASWAPDSTILAVASDSAVVRVWNVESGDEMEAFAGHRDAVRSLDFSPDGKVLATGAKDATIRLWNVDRAETIRVMEEPEYPVERVRFSPDGQVLLAGSLQMVRPEYVLWSWDLTSNMRQGRVVKRLPERSCRPITFSPDGKWVARGQDGKLAILAWPTGKEVTGFAVRLPSVTDIAFSPDSTTLAISHSSDITLFDIPQRRILAQWKAHERFVQGVAFCRDGRTLISAGGRRIRYWDLQSELRQKGPLNSVGLLAFPPTEATGPVAGIQLSRRGCIHATFPAPAPKLQVLAVTLLWP